MAKRQTPPEVYVKIRELMDSLPVGQAFALTIRTNGFNEYKTEISIVDKIIIATAQYNTTRGWMPTDTRGLPLTNQ